MANYEGYNLGINAQFESVKQAESALGAVNAQLVKVRENAARMKVPAEFPREIEHIDTLTASYIKRLESEGKTYEANKQKIKAYGSALQELNDKQEDLKHKLSEIKAKSGETSTAYRNQKILINQNATEIKKYQDALDRLNPTGFNRVIRGAKRVDEATTAMKSKLHSAFDSIRGGATVAAAGIGALGATALTGAKKAGAIQQTYREINNLAVLGGEKQKEVTGAVTKMQAQGRDMAIKYGKSQQEIAEGYEDLIKRGYTTTQALGAMQTELQASIASGDKFSDVTTVSSQVLDAFGMRAKSTTGMIRNTKKAVNELAYSADATSTGFQSLGIGMSYVGTAAKANKLSLAETASAMGVLSNNGLEADKAGTGLRSTINGITNQINKIGKKGSVFSQLGIKKSEMLDAHGNMKSLSQDMAVLYKHIEQHSKGGADQNGFFKSIFGTTGMNAAEILAKNSKEVTDLTKRTEKAGESGKYVAELASKNMQTAQMQTARAKQAATAFQMELGAKLLPAINKAGNNLAKFLTTKDGKQFEKDVGGAVTKVSNSLIGFTDWAVKHKGTMKAIGGAVLSGYVISKGASFISFLGDTKQSIQELKGSSSILNSLAGAITNLNVAENSGSGAGLLSKLPFIGKTKGASSVIAEGKMVKKPGLIRSTLGNAKATIQDIPYMLPGSEMVGKVGSKMLTPFRFAKNVAGTALHPINAFEGTKVAQGMAGTKLGGAALTGLKGIGTATSVLSGVGVAATSGYDIYTALKSKNKKARYTNLGKGIGSAIGGGIGLWFGGAPGALLGTTLGKIAGGWAGKMASGFKKSKFGQAIKSDFKQTMYSVKLTSNSAFKGVGKDLKGLNRTFGSSFKQMNKDTKPLQNFFKAGFVAVVRTGIRLVGSTLRRGIKVIAGAIHAFSKTVAGIGAVFKGAVSVISDLMHGKWRKAWKDFTKYGGEAIKDFKGAVSGLWTVVKNTFGWIGDTVKNVWDFVTGKSWGVHKQATGKTTSVKSANSSVARMRSGAAGWTRSKSTSTNYGDQMAANNARIARLSGHARGGFMSTNHGALVGEDGPELAYKPYGNARLLGANGPELASVRSGERILNARDTRKVMNGGLGNGVILKGYAGGNTSLSKTTKEVPSDYKKMTSKSSRTLTSFAKKNRSTWRGVSTQTKRENVKTRRNAINEYKTMRQGVHKQMDSLHDHTISLAKTTSRGFGKELDRMKGYARNAMAGTVDEINKGIRGIDRVLGQFGGNTSVIKPVKFANGTDPNGRLTRDTFAMVNDATSGPRQEAIISDKNEVFMPRGRNLKMMIPKGYGVLNGTQTMQAGLTHFAKGSGVSKSALQKIADRNSSNPSRAFAEEYTSNLQSKAPDIQRGTTDLAKNASTQLGNPWSSAMWSVIEDAIGSANGKGGTREAFLKYAKSTFSHVRYVMGAASKTASDCSGMVMQALRHFGVDIGRTTVAMQGSSGTQYLGKDLSKTLPGDLVIFGHGTGAAGHVGIIKNPKTGSMFNETPPYARVTDIASDKSMGYGYYRVRGLHNAKPKSSQAKVDNGLKALAKRELGAKAIGWIKNNLADDESMSFGKAIGDHSHWLKQAHIPEKYWSAMSYIFSHEAGWNPHARNPSSGTYGLGQMQGYNLHYYRKYGSINNALAQIRGSYDYMNERYGSPNGAAKWWQSHHWYAKGGNPPVGDTVMVGEHGPELAKFKSPVHIYSNEQSRKLSFNDLLNKKPRATRLRTSAPTININLNGNISSERDAKKYSDMIASKIEQVFEALGNDFGGDPSVY